MLSQNVKMITPDLPVEDMRRARAFFEDLLGFEPAIESEAGILYRIGESGGLFIYQHAATKAEHTEASFMIDDLDAEMADLREKGIVFEEYNMPEIGLKTENGVAEMEGMRGAWFKDTEGNILNLNEVS